MMQLTKRLITSKNTSTAIQLLISLVLVSIVQWTQGEKFFDDAFITFRYARNISQGLGFVYNIDQHVLGTTTPLYTLILATIAWLTNPDLIPKSALVISLLADVLNIWLIYRIAKWIFNDQIVALIIAAVFLLQPLRLDVAGGGMETSLFITILLIMYDRYLIGERSLFTACWAGLAFLMRPDSIIAILPVFIDWIIHDRKRTIMAVGVFSLISLPWIVWATAYFGNPIPQSIIAKGATSHQPLGSAAYFLLTFISTGSVGPYPSFSPMIPGVIIFILLAALGCYCQFRIKPTAIVIGCYPLLYILVMILINPPLHFAWYYPPLMLGMIILMMAIIRHLISTRYLLNNILVGLFSAILIGTPLIIMTLYPNWPLARSREMSFWNACASIKGVVQPGQIVLAPDIGILGWCLGRANILDSNGLVSPEAAKYDQKISLKLLSDKQPDYIISLEQFLDQNLRKSPQFLNSYSQLWKQDVKITGSTQGIYIYKRVK